MSPIVDPEQLLRENRPRPSARFRADLGRRLISAEPRFRLPALRSPVWIGAGAVLALSLLALVLSLSDISPLGGESDPVSADRSCRKVTVVESPRAPQIVERADGSVVLRYERRPTARRVTRCR